MRIIVILIGLVMSLPAFGNETCDVSSQRDEFFEKYDEFWNDLIYRAANKRGFQIKELKLHITRADEKETSRYMVNAKLASSTGAPIALVFLTPNNASINSEFLLSGEVIKTYNQDGSLKQKICMTQSSVAGFPDESSAFDFYFAKPFLVNIETGIVVSDLFVDGISYYYCMTKYQDAELCDQGVVWPDLDYRWWKMFDSKAAVERVIQ